MSLYSSELHDAFTGKVKVVQSCPTLGDPRDYTVHGILQARILEWVAFPFSRGASQRRIESRSPTLQADSLPAEPPGKRKNTGVGRLSLLHCYLPDPGIEPGPPALQVDSLPAELPGKPLLLTCSLSSLQQHCTSLKERTGFLEGWR